MINKLIETLEFYANQDNYRQSIDIVSEVEYDRGRAAQRVLDLYRKTEGAKVNNNETIKN